MIILFLILVVRVHLVPLHLAVELGAYGLQLVRCGLVGVHQGNICLVFVLYSAILQLRVIYVLFSVN